MTPPHGVEATPCAALKPETLYSSVGGLDLPQYRMVVTHDMNGHFVKTDSVVEFLDAFLPYPSTAPKRRMRQTNPFESLVNADKLVEADVVALFTKAVKSKNLCPNMEYLVGKPLHLPSGAVGRGTCGYVALDCETRRFVWLKDAWRASDLVTEREGDILRKLNWAGIPNVPSLVCHGDVQDQVTVTNEWWYITHDASSGSSPGSMKRKRDEETGGEESLPDPTGRAPSATPGQSCPLQRYTHYRIAVEEVAMPSSLFRRGKQLASIALDCLRAHHQAATNHKTQLLHRDISSGNILIYPKLRPDEDGKGQSMCWTGILTDWELARPVDTPRSLQANRVGTHQFMSVNLLGNPFQTVEIPDELESFFHVLVYYSVCYLRSNCTCPTSWINNFFLAYGLPNVYWGGMKTVAIRQDGQLTTLSPQGPLLFNSPMDRLLGELLKSFTAHYKVTAHDCRQAISPFSSSSSSAASSPGADKTGSQGASTKRPKIHVPVPCYSDDSEFSEVTVATGPSKPPDNTPTPEERELARRVADHDFMLDFIARMLRRSWPGDDRIPAPAPQLEPDPDPESEPASVDAAPAPKRRRRAAPKAKEKATKPAAQPARRPSTTRQTRSQTRAASSKTPLGRKP